MFFKIDVLKNFTIFTGNHLCWSLFLIKFQAFIPATSTQVFSSEYFQIFKNISLYKSPLVAASKFLTKLAKNKCKENHFSVEIFSEIFQKSFLSLSCNVFKDYSFTAFSQFLSFFKHVCQRGIKNPFKHQDGAFIKIVNSSRGVFRTESNIEDGSFCVNSEQLK